MATGSSSSSSNNNITMKTGSNVISMSSKQAVSKLSPPELNSNGNIFPPGITTKKIVPVGSAGSQKSESPEKSALSVLTVPI